MRLCVRLWNGAEQRLPLSHLDLLRDTLEGTNESTTLPVSFSDLRVPAKFRRIDRSTGELVITPGILQWWIASPDEVYLTRLAARIAANSSLTVGKAAFLWRESISHFFPRIGGENAPVISLRFSCRTPIVAAGAVSRTPDAYEPFVRQALLDMFARVNNRAPISDTVDFAFDAGYLQTHPRGGTKRIDWRGEAVDGILAPFVLTAHPELLRTAWDCGIGERTGDGFGFAEVTNI